MGLVLGLLYANFLEWFVHKYIFHKLGKKRGSIWAYHLKEHHKTARKNNFVDKKVSKIEIFGMIFLVLIHLPFLWISVGFFAGTAIYAVAFKIIHEYQHRNPEFTKKYMRWHWEHHMKDSNKNFGVVACWADHYLKTRKKYQ